MPNSKQQKRTMFICTVCTKQFSSDTWRMRHIEYSHLFKHQKFIQTALNFSLNELLYNQETNPKIFKPNSEPHSISNVEHHKNQQLHQVDQIESESVDQSSPQPDFPTSMQVSDGIRKTDTYKNAGLPLVYVPTVEELNSESQQWNTDPWYPFSNAMEFCFSEILIPYGASRALIDDLLKVDSGKVDSGKVDSGLQVSVKESLKSSYILHQKIDSMRDGIGPHSWNQQTTNLRWNKSCPQPIEFYSRDIVSCAQWLLSQRAYKDQLVYAPEHQYMVEGYRLFNQMHTGDWWWEVQVFKIIYPINKLINIFLFRKHYQMEKHLFL
jgi:hypothetical protein